MKPHQRYLRRRSLASVRSQRGAILIIALIMLVLITMVSMHTVRSTAMEEKMAGNTRDRDKAFQAAEAAVRACLVDIKAGTYTGVAPTKLDPAPVNASQVWDVAANWDTSSPNSLQVTVDTDGLAAQPRCMIEELGTGTGSYRITGRAVGGSTRAVVVLQATYSTE